MTPVTRPTETAVFVPVPEAEPAVAEPRLRLDRAAQWGVPAHVTVLYPFVPPDEVDRTVLDRLEAAVRTVHAFDCVFSRTRWFGRDVVWLAPEPAGPFRDLTEAVWRAFPDHPPYGGVHEEVVPHLTVGDAQAGTVEELRAAEALVTRRLPVRARIDRVVLAAGDSEANSWTVLREYLLTDAPEPAPWSQPGVTTPFS